MPSVREFRVKISRSHRTSCIARCLRWLVQTNNYALHDIDQMRCVWVSERKYLRFFVEITCVWILLALIWMRVPTAFLVFSRKLNKTEIKWVSKTRRTQTPAHLHFGNWRVLIVPFRELSVPVRWRCHTQFSTNSFVSKSMSSSKWMPHAISVWIEVFSKSDRKGKEKWKFIEFGHCAYWLQSFRFAWVLREADRSRSVSAKVMTRRTCGATISPVKVT